MFLIAIVDDDEKELQELDGYVNNYFEQKKEAKMVHIFRNGVEFIRSEEMYDIVFKDIRMVDMDGQEVAR
ncbi:MAG: hypothetical protein LUF30_06385, partial [Lachnospiraceae bacterium]|nr:hypothetical protein [Lachnospiraceae bacterium]